MPHVNAKVTAVPATALGMSAAAAALPRKWEGVDPALERMVLRACLDQAPERRRVREAFKGVQLSIDHCLFKAQYNGIRTTELTEICELMREGNVQVARVDHDASGARHKLARIRRTQPRIAACLRGFLPEIADSYELNSRGVEIFSKSWFPENRRMKAIVCLCHGYGDTCTFFLDGIARKIASAGYGVFALDYPGFGLSEGLHGYIPSFDTLVDDVAETFAKFKGNPDYRGLPSFLFGQSMGGAVALKIHFKQPNEWSGAILVAPMCKMSDDVVPAWPVQQVLIFLAKLFPKEKLVPQKDLAELAFKEEEKREQTSYNVIAYKDKPRLRTALEMLRTTQEIESRLEEVSLPIIILHGDADLVTDPAVSKDLYEKAKTSDKTLRLYKDAYHSILEGEPDEAIFQVLDDITSWLDQHSMKEGSSS